MYTSILYKTHLDLLSVPRLWGEKQTQNTREAWDTTQFLEFVTYVVVAVYYYV